MKIMKIDTASLKTAVSLLRKGGVIVYPTDTAYALGCDATNKKAVERIYKIKKRPMRKPLPVIVGSFDLAKKFFRFTPQEFRLAKKYWPGALSIISTPTFSPYFAEGETGGVSARGGSALGGRGGSFSPCSDALVGIGGVSARGGSALGGRGGSFSPYSPTRRGTGGDRGGGVAVRVPDNKIARFLSSRLKKPIISTSANVSGMGECYSIKEVMRQFQGQKHQPDFLIDGGRLKKIKPSTIIRVSDRKIEVVRKGAIKL